MAKSSTATSVKILSKSQLLGGTLRRKPVPLPGLGGGVIAKELSGNEAFEFTRQQKENADDAVYYLLITGIVDDNDAPILDKSDVDALKKQGASLINTLTNAVLEVSGMKEDPEAKKRGSEGTSGS